MSNLPPGVTPGMIDDLYETAWQEEARAEVEAWLTEDAGWWRRYVSSDRAGRRDSLLGALAADVGVQAPDLSYDELSDRAEDLRAAEIRWAHAMAARHLRWQAHSDVARAILVDAMMMGGQR